MSTETAETTDPARGIVAAIKRDHWQHVCENHPEPGICVHRCAGPWPCGAARAAAAVEVALSQHRPSRHQAWGQGTGNLHGHFYCAGICWTSVDDMMVSQVWPCQPYQDITSALLGEKPVPPHPEEKP